METATYTPEQALDFGFSEDELALLREAGLIEDRLAEPWQPQTLADVSWLIGRLRAIPDERAALAARMQRRIERSEAAEAALLSRYAEPMRAIVEANLPRQKDGSYAKKSLDLDDGRVGLRTSRGGTLITDEGALWEHYRALWQAYDPFQDEVANPIPAPLLEAVSITEKLTGYDAIADAIGKGVAPKFSLTPLRQFIDAGQPDPATGEVVPAELPGVEVVPPSDRFFWD